MFHLDPSNRLATLHQRRRQTGPTARQTDNGFANRRPKIEYVCCLLHILVTVTDSSQIIVFAKCLRQLKDKVQCLQPVDVSKKLRLTHGVVRGMEYLHSVQPDSVVHGDLKTQNVLVGDGLIAKVCVNQILHLEL